jgi:hypothetical protein
MYLKNVLKHCCLAEIITKGRDGWAPMDGLKRNSIEEAVPKENKCSKDILQQPRGSP